MYQIKFSQKAEVDFLELKKSEPQAYKKALSFLQELETHPRTGIGHPEQLRHFKQETWSREINKKHRLIYEIYENFLSVYLVKAKGHYFDK